MAVTVADFTADHCLKYAVMCDSAPCAIISPIKGDNALITKPYMYEEFRVHNMCIKVRGPLKLVYSAVYWRILHLVVFFSRDI